MDKTKLFIIEPNFSISYENPNFRGSSTKNNGALNTYYKSKRRRANRAAGRQRALNNKIKKHGKY